MGSNLKRKRGKFMNKILYYFKKSIGGGDVVEELRKNGAKIGKNVFIYTKNIDAGHNFLISIGDNVTIAANATLLTHDASTKRELGYSKVGKIEIGNNVFVGACAIILPNVKIGNDVIIGAGTLVNKNIPENSVVVGNPARRVCSYKEYIEKEKKLMKKAPTFNTYWMEKSDEEKKEMMNQIQIGTIGFDI